MFDLLDFICIHCVPLNQSYFWTKAFTTQGKRTSLFKLHDVENSFHSCLSLLGFKIKKKKPRYIAVSFPAWKDCFFHQNRIFWEHLFSLATTVTFSWLMWAFCCHYTASCLFIFI